MFKHFRFICLLALASCSRPSLIEKNVDIQLFPYEEAGKKGASAMPKLRESSELNRFSRRFEYLLINVPAINSPAKAERRTQIFNLYPDTSELKRQYLQEFILDRELEKYFDATEAAITNKNSEASTNYQMDEVMEVASKFFYCDQVFPDTSVQSHVCVGLNGISEANWKKDYRLLEAFCYEAIFDDLMKDESRLDESYAAKKKEARLKYKPSIRTLEQYLLDVRQELFKSMKEDPVLKSTLLRYYETNKTNLAFRVNI